MPQVLKIIKYPVIPITIAFVVGIFFAKNIYSWFSETVLYFIIGSLLSIIIIFYFASFRLWLHLRKLMLPLFLVLFFLVGSVNYRLNNIPPSASELSSSVGQIKVTKVLKPNKTHDRYEASFFPKDKTIAPFNILFYSSKKQPKLHIGSVGMDSVSIHHIPPPKSPMDFDYAAYLANKNIYFQAYATSNYSPVGTVKSWRWYIAQVRQTILNSFESSEMYSDENKKFIGALLFGQKNTIDNEQLNLFRKTGVAHLFAISGLHVLILFGFIQAFFKRIRIHRELSAVAISVILISFALLADLSASVVRAVLMCMLYLIAHLLKRNAPPHYILCLSAFIILWFAPNSLFDIGFQLSYLAVFSIIIIFPYFYERIQRIKYSFLKYLLNVLALSFSIQLGLGAWSIYHFHHFPVMFLLSNLISIPLVTGILLLLFIQVCLNSVAFIGNPLAYLTNSLLELLTNSLNFIHSFSYDNFEDIYFSTNTLWTYTIVVFLFFLFIRKRQASHLLLIFIVLCTSSMIELSKHYTTPKQKLYIIENKKHIDLVFEEKNNLKIFTTQNKFTTPYDNFFRKKITQKEHFTHALISHPKIWVVDSTSYYPTNTPFDYVILTNNPKINLEYLLLHTQPKEIIICKNNTPVRVKSWTKYLDQNGQNYTDLRKKGYYSQIIQN